MTISFTCFSYDSSSSSSSSSSLSASHVLSNDNAINSGITGRFIRHILTYTFAAVGSMVGAVTGGVIGLTTESGPLRGAGIGAISGAVFTIEAFESTLASWPSNESKTRRFLYAIDIICRLLSGRLVTENFGPTLQTAIQNQMDALDAPLIETVDIFDPGCIRSMTRESVDKISKIRITSHNNVDHMGDKICCVVCMEDFERGETVRCLPHCHHKFHLPCIDVWLMRHGSCPLCRRDLIPRPFFCI